MLKNSVLKRFEELKKDIAVSVLGKSIGLLLTGMAWLHGLKACLDPKLAGIVWTRSSESQVEEVLDQAILPAEMMEVHALENMAEEIIKAGDTPPEELKEIIKAAKGRLLVCLKGHGMKGKRKSKKKYTNMYRLSVSQWNPFVGCDFSCVYCLNSFQGQLKRWAKANCEQCYTFTPHTHENRLSQQLPRTGYEQFIFTCSSGDIAFCPTEYLMKVVSRIKKEKEKVFLIQSKCPKTFKKGNFPGNAVLGVTLETNRDELYKGISRAPGPSQRYKDFLKVNHPVKMVTIEPVIDFDLNIMVSWIEDINPCMVWLGYDSRKNNLPEPELDKVENLYWELGRRGFTVVLKKVRKAWFEK